MRELCRQCLLPHRACTVPTLSFVTASQCEHCADIVFCHTVREPYRHCLSMPHRARTVPTLSFATPCQCEHCADIVFCHSESVREPSHPASGTVVTRILHRAGQSFSTVTTETDNWCSITFSQLWRLSCQSKRSALAVTERLPLSSSRGIS